MYLPAWFIPGNKTRFDDIMTIDTYA